MSHHKRSALLAALFTAALFAGCQTPKHTDLLVFGTNTQFGVSVSTDATSTPGVNIGFKRQEVVLMPLYVNGQDSKFLPSEPKTPTPDNKYVGTDGTSQPKTDTYSVLASFGASGGGQTTGSAKVGIAQYFATGLAARTLAYAGGALINTGDKAAEVAPQTAKAAADAETKSVSAAIVSHRESEAALRAKILAHAGTLSDAQLLPVVDGAKNAGLIPAAEDVSDATKQRAALKKHIIAGDDPDRLVMMKNLAKALSI
jgi:hypothetical protein